MKNLEEIFKSKRYREWVKENTEYNENGDAVISRDDPWFYDDVWEDYLKKLDEIEEGE